MQTTSKYSAELKHKLVLFVLEKTPVWLFNIAIREFSTQRLYNRYKPDLMSEFKEVMPYTLDYAIVMAEAFSDYQCDETACKNIRFKIDQLSYNIKLVKRYNGHLYSELVNEHNKLIEQYTELIQPQNKLIKLYKKLKTRPERYREGMKIIGSLFGLNDLPMPMPKHTDNEAIALMHKYLTDMFRSTADHVEKHNLSSDEIIRLLRELADESEAQEIVVNLRDNH